MHRVLPAEGTPDRAADAARLARVAVAGATGYTGQELVRILSRHPGVTLTAAMSSGSTSASARRLPALARAQLARAVALRTGRLVVYAPLPRRGPPRGPG
jgi:hypothetical protein